MGSIDDAGELPGALCGLRWRWMLTIAAVVVLACAACLGWWALHDFWPSRAERRFDAVLAGQATDAAPVGPQDFVEVDAGIVRTRVHGSGEVRMWQRPPCRRDEIVRQVDPAAAVRLVAAVHAFDWHAVPAVPFARDTPHHTLELVVGQERRVIRHQRVPFEGDARHLLTRSMREIELAAGAYSALDRCDREQPAP